MKQILIILSLFFASEIQAQKLYAFSQRIVPGRRQATMDKDGNVNMEKRKEQWAHSIYLEIPSGKNILVTEVWLNGERYAFGTATVNGPIMEETGLTVPGYQGKTLIPASKNKLLYIIPREKINSTDTHKRNISARKKVVVHFTRNGKRCYKSSDKIEKLPEMLMQ